MQACRQSFAGQASTDIESKLIVAAGRERQATPRWRHAGRHVAVPHINVPHERSRVPGQKNNIFKL